MSGNATVNEASTYTLNLGAITDPGHTDIFTGYDINWGDGSPLQHVTLGTPQTAATWSGAVQTHVYDDGPASRSIVVSLEDQYSPFVFVAGSQSVSVQDVPPTATFVNFGSVNEGSPGFVEFLNPTDVSAADRAAGFTYSYDFNNDGSFTDPGDIANSSSPSATVPASILSHPGDYTIHGRIIDKDGGFTDYRTTIQVNNVTPIVNLPSSATVNQNTLLTQMRLVRRSGHRDLDRYCQLRRWVGRAALDAQRGQNLQPQSRLCDGGDGHDHGQRNRSIRRDWDCANDGQRRCHHVPSHGPQHEQ